MTVKFRFIDRTNDGETSYTVVVPSNKARGWAPIGEVVRLRPGVWSARTKWPLGEFATRREAAERLVLEVTA